MLFITFVVLCATTEVAQPLPSNIKITYMNIVSEIQARFAITDIVAEVVNEADFAQEITYEMQLPATAFISSFYMQVTVARITL